jgi:hypothetical protein
MQEFTEDKKQNEGKNNGKYDIEYPFSFVKPVHKDEKNQGERDEGDKHESYGIDDHRPPGNQQDGKIAPFRFVGLEVFFLFPQVGYPENESQNNDDDTNDDGKISWAGSAVHSTTRKAEGRNHENKGHRDTNAGKYQTRYTHPHPHPHPLGPRYGRRKGNALELGKHRGRFHRRNF